MVPLAVPKKKEKAPKTKEPEPWCGKVWQAGKYWARKLEQGYAQHMHAQWIIDEQLENLTHPPLLDAPYSSGEDMDEVVKLSKPVVVPAFSSTIVKGLTDETIITGHWLHVVTQAPYPEDEANLPVRLYVLRNYCEIKDSSQSVYLVLRNGTSWPICLSGGQLIR